MSLGILELNLSQRILEVFKIALVFFGANPQDLKELFPKESWGDLHLQIIFYGRESCPARDCYGLKCDICNSLFPKRRSKVITNKA